MITVELNDLQGRRVVHLDSIYIKFAGQCHKKMQKTRDDAVVETETCIGNCKPANNTSRKMLCATPVRLFQSDDHLFSIKYTTIYDEYTGQPVLESVSE